MTPPEAPSSPPPRGQRQRPGRAGSAAFAGLTGAAVLGLLWLVFGLYAAGQPLWAALLLGGGVITIVIYASARTLAWRYLFPGVAGMLVFVAFPLLYTMQIGFTNYSASNLLTEERARAYLLDQRLADEDQARVFSLHAEGSGWRLLLSPPEGRASGQRFVTPLLRLDGSDPSPVALTPLPGDAPDKPLPLREVLTHRKAVMALTLQPPDGGALLHYSGVREFGPVQPLWMAHTDGSLTQFSGQAVYRPNRETGFFETASGERMQPGFKVGIGLANYSRMLLDPDFRGPFVSIFIWTVLFAGLTVLFSVAIGMTLAVLLNWEALKYRTLYRTLLFLPYAVPGFISILVFKGLFNQNFGEINAILDAVFGIRPAWFADPLLAKVMILIVNTWLGFPYFLVLCTGLIKAIPADLYEASAIAGAKPLVNFFRITMPLIARPLTPLLISAFAFNFNNFVLISLLTDGRPDYLNTKLPAGTNDILVSYTYRIAFTDAGANFGLAAAISTLIFFMVGLMALAQLKITQTSDSKR